MRTNGTGAASEALVLRPDDGPPAPLRFWVDAGGRWFVVAERRDVGWSVRLRAGAAVGVAPPHGPRSVRVGRELRDAEEIARVREGFRGKYGDAAWDRYFSGGISIWELVPAERTGPDDPSDRLRREFDAASEVYDGRIRSDPVQSELRRRSLAWLLPRLRGRDPILEIGCGSGIETVPILRAGHRVVALDISPEMLARTREAAAAVGAADRFTGVVGRLATCGAALRPFGDAAFAGAFSTFGAFNLERDLAGARDGLGRALGAGAPLLIGSLGRWAPGTVAFELVSGRPRSAVHRLEDPIPAGGHQFALEVVPRSPGRLARELAPEFVPVSARAASVLLPPRNLPRLARALGPRAAPALARLDGRLSEGPWAAPFGEWAFVALRRS